MKIEQQAKVDTDFAAQVGSELAMLIAEAEANGPNAAQRLVVRPFPVHRAGSLLDEEVDLTSHSGVLSSCQAIADSLRDSGLLTGEEYTTATSRLSFNERPWPEQPPVSSRANLYLDSLATTYLLHLGLLELLHAGGFTAFVSPTTLARANDLLAYESISTDVHRVLERIRRTVSSRIIDGRIRVGPLSAAEPSEQPAADHPTMDLLRLVDRCDVLVTDDRFINGLPSMDAAEGRSVPTVSTLDVLDMLTSARTISPADRLTHRTRLRRAGFFFVPVEREELSSHLRNARVVDEHIVETAELAAVRESLLMVRMSDCLRLPDELPWLAATMEAFADALQDLWREGLDIPELRARSDWILYQIDPRGWTHCLPLDSSNRSMEGDRAQQLIRLLLPPPEVSAEVKAKYWEWIEDRRLKPIQETEPTLYSWLVETFSAHRS